MPKSFEFDEQMEVGREGVALATSLFEKKYGAPYNYEAIAFMQHRGVDLYVSKLGYVEVKTDLHTTKNFFFELSVDGGPGGLDKSAADYFAFLFPNEGKMFLIKRPDLMHWLRDWSAWSRHQESWSQKIVESHQGENTWTAIGLVVPWVDVLAVIDAITVTFADLSDGSAALWEGEE